VHPQSVRRFLGHVRVTSVVVKLEEGGTVEFSQTSVGGLELSRGELKIKEKQGDEWGKKGYIYISTKRNSRR